MLCEIADDDVDDLDKNKQDEFVLELKELLLIKFALREPPR